MAEKHRKGHPRTTASTTAKLSQEVIDWLSFGWIPSWRWELHHTDSDKEKLWAKVADDFTRAWSQSHPGCRPFGFWSYNPELPGPRRVLGPIPEGDGGLMRAYGAPLMSLDGTVTVESQAEYLRRHNLLGREELARLTPKDFRPPILPPGQRELLPGELDEGDDDAS